MGKFLSVIVGGLAALVGFILLISWWTWFLRGMMVVAPAMLIFGGVIAVIAGLSEMKDATQVKKEEKK